MKTLNPSIERLEERVAPDLFGSIGIGVIVGIGGQVGVAGPGNGTSCYTNSDSSGGVSAFIFSGETGSCMATSISVERESLPLKGCCPLHRR